MYVRMQVHSLPVQPTIGTVRISAKESVLDMRVRWICCVMESAGTLRESGAVQISGAHCVGHCVAVHTAAYGS